MFENPPVPFSLPELSIRWARNAVRAHAVLQRLTDHARETPQIDLLVNDARAVLDGATKDPAACHEMTGVAWASVECWWDSCCDDPLGTRHALFMRYADASASAASDWLRAAS